MNNFYPQVQNVPKDYEPSFAKENDMFANNGFNRNTIQTNLNLETGNQKLAEPILNFNKQKWRHDDDDKDGFENKKETVYE